MTAAPRDLSSDEILQRILTSLDDDKAEDVVTIDLRGRSAMHRLLHIWRESLMNRQRATSPRSQRSVLFVVSTRGSIAIAGSTGSTYLAMAANQQTCSSTHFRLLPDRVGEFLRTLSEWPNRRGCVSSRDMERRMTS